MAEALTLFPLIGQINVWQRWQKLLNSGRLGHAHLLIGKAGVGKDALALNIAASVNCHGAGGKPCGACPACGQIKSLEHSALHLVFALPRKTASKTDPMDGLTPKEMDTIREELSQKAAWPYYRLNIPGANDIRISSIRKLRTDIYLRSNPGETKVILILRAHKLNTEAANALLKILEEPPAGSLFLLTTEYPEKLPDTILSRCQQHQVPDLPWSVIRDHLVEEFEISKADAQVAAQLSQGSLELARQFSGGETREWMELLSATVAMLQNDDFPPLLLLAQTLGDKTRFDEASREQFLSLLVLFFRDLAQAASGTTESIWKNEISAILENFPRGNPSGAITVIERTLDALSRKVYLPLALTSLFLSLRKELRGSGELEFEEALFS